MLKELGQIVRALIPSIVTPPKQTSQAYRETVHTTSRTTPPQRSTTEQAREEEDTPKVFPLLRLARGLGLQLDMENQRICREHVSAPFTYHFDSIDNLTHQEREAATANLLAARFILDQQLVEWTPDLERLPINQTPAYQKKDVPSSYGERLPRLVPTSTREQLEHNLKAQGKTLLHEPFSAHFDIIFALEVGKYFHIMTVEDAKLCNLDRERIIADARYMLFYQSYKIKPTKETHPWGKARHYITTEGLGATRAILLPDFDINASREDGFAAIVSRDYLLAVEPNSPEDRDAAKQWCINTAQEAQLQERYPHQFTLIGLSIDDAIADIEDNS